MGKWEIRPLATPKPLTDRHKKFWIYTHKQNLITIPQGVSFPRMREIAHQNVYSASFLVLPTHHSQGPRNDFQAQYTK